MIPKAIRDKLYDPKSRTRYQLAQERRARHQDMRPRVIRPKHPPPSPSTLPMQRRPQLNRTQKMVGLRKRLAGIGGLIREGKVSGAKFNIRRPTGRLTAMLGRPFDPRGKGRKEKTGIWLCGKDKSCVRLRGHSGPHKSRITTVDLRHEQELRRETFLDRMARGKQKAKERAILSKTPQGRSIIEAAKKFRKRRHFDPPQRWMDAMTRGLLRSSDISEQEARGHASRIWRSMPSGDRRKAIHDIGNIPRTYDLPLPQDATHRGGIIRVVKPFNLAEAQVDVTPRVFEALGKTGIFQQMRRRDGSIALVKRAKSNKGNVNIFVDRRR